MTCYFMQHIHVTPLKEHSYSFPQIYYLRFVEKIKKKTLRNHLISHVHCIKTCIFTGFEHNTTQLVFKMEPTSKRYNWINTALILVTLIFVLVAVAYFIMQIVERNMERVSTS